MYRQAGRTGLSLRGGRCWGVTDRGAGSIKKLGGAVSRGTFRKKRAPKKFSLGMLVTVGGGEVGWLVLVYSKKISDMS